MGGAWAEPMPDWLLIIQWHAMGVSYLSNRLAGVCLICPLGLQGRCIFLAYIPALQ